MISHKIYHAKKINSIALVNIFSILVEYYLFVSSTFKKCIYYHTMTFILDYISCFF
ncbi:DUF3822 family protein [Staphylococcus delphini]|uniref:DUF3822 family protein n=1 Tax=Staphylococcus delphini TaxID=53344 RepID=UPI0011550E3E